MSVPIITDQTEVGTLVAGSLYPCLFPQRGEPKSRIVDQEGSHKNIDQRLTHGPTVCEMPFPWTLNNPEAINILKALPTPGRVWHGEPCYGLNWNTSAYCLAWRSSHLFTWFCVCFLSVYHLFACFFSGVLMGMEMNWSRHITPTSWGPKLVAGCLSLP